MLMRTMKHGQNITERTIRQPLREALGATANRLWRHALVTSALLPLALTGACATDPAPECEEGVSESRVCGLNDRGMAIRVCQSGLWGEFQECDDPDACVDGTSEMQACGLNGRGTQDQLCNQGTWNQPGPCADPDECVDGATEQWACGLNGRGIQMQLCDQGAWGEPVPCEDPDECVDDQVESAACGLLGVHSRQCAVGQWGPYETCDDPDNLLIDVPGRRDMVYDDQRNLLYITTSLAGNTGEVRVFDLVARQFIAPLVIDGGFNGIDLSPDGNRLVVADSATGVTTNWIHLIDLPTGVADKLEFPLAFSEGGTFTAVFTSDTEALVTSRFNGSGWVPMRRVDLTNGTADSLPNVRQNTMLAVSADGSTVAYAESNISSGEWGRYDVGTQNFMESSTGWFVYEITVSRDGSQYALPTYSGLRIFNDALSSVTTVGNYASDLPIGAVYSPVVDEIYLAWRNASVSIDAYSTITFDQVRTIEPTPGLFSWYGSNAFVGGRLRISRDGTLLFVTTDDQVRIYRVGL